MNKMLLDIVINALMLATMWTMAPSCRSRSGEGIPAQGHEDVAARSVGGQATTLSLLTYNVLADPLAVQERVPRLLEVIGESKADVVALQEVAPWFLELLAREAWIGEYDYSRFDGAMAAPGGQLILSRFPIQASYYRVLPGPQRRTVVVSTIAVNGRSIAIATTHLDSPLESGPTRAEQLDAIFGMLEPADEAILAGDLNFGDGEEPETSHLPSSYVDLWLNLAGGMPGYTWNIEASDMARLTSFPGEPSRRLDRIIVRSVEWVPGAVSIVGDSPVHPGSKDLFPSDHFGVLGVLKPARGSAFHAGCPRGG
ncbi:MAG: endonuclease/exonuclease/phosphatase family protein [Deltaproteobacteria bacterium]|nr:endonuclease/exonuclease/phosphatase family protein [Deltaproteobacteria bacterium]